MTLHRVLIVDDNPVNLTLARYVLANAGFLVDTAEDAAGAIAKTAAFRPHLILMDIQLKGTDGLRVTRQLKADPSSAGIVIVAFTAHVTEGDEAEMLAGGCDGYIGKPFDVLTFADEVRALL